MLARYAAAELPPDPQSLQLLFFDPPPLDADALTAFLRPHVPDAVCELAPAPPGVVNADGPPASVVGLVTFGDHTVKVIVFHAPMPYGPVEACVGPALIPPPMKVDAKQHKAHALLYHAGPHSDPMERFAALCLVAGALARFDAICVLNEEARAAAPAFDLIPDDGEDAMATYRTLPLPYLFGGFLKLDTGDEQRPWVRTFANHRLGLPNLARHLSSHDQTADTFKLFAGMLGYLRQTGEAFAAGDTLDFGEGAPMRLREPAEAEWWLDGEGVLVIE